MNFWIAFALVVLIYLAEHGFLLAGVRWASKGPVIKAWPLSWSSALNELAQVGGFRPYVRLDASSFFLDDVSHNSNFYRIRTFKLVFQTKDEEKLQLKARVWIFSLPLVFAFLDALEIILLLTLICVSAWMDYQEAKSFVRRAIRSNRQ